MRWNSGTSILLIMGLCTGALAAEKADRAQKVRATYELNLKKFKNRTDVLVRPGMIADRAAGKLLVDAEATGIKSGETAEFILVGPKSDHGYEAIAMSYADAWSIHEGLEFLGMKPGLPVDFGALRFWPKGERVNVLLEVAKNGETKTIPAETLVLDKRTGKSIRAAGFVFVGSAMMQDTAGSGKSVYAADHRGPHSILSNYNEPDSVLDVPRQAVQGEVYDHQVLASEFLLEAHSPIRIIMSPEIRDGNAGPRVMNIALSVERGKEAVAGLAGLMFGVTGDKGLVKNAASLNEVLEMFTDLVAGKHDPFVTVSLNGELMARDAGDLCKILASIETETGIRVDAPPKDQLYYRAFLPREDFRSRKKRYAQPWELHLKRNEKGTPVANLVEITQSWSNDKIAPDLSVKSIPVATPGDFKKELTTRKGIPVILVFAGEGITLGQIMTFIRPVRGTHPTVHVYAGDVEE